MRPLGQSNLLARLQVESDNSRDSSVCSFSAVKIYARQKKPASTCGIQIRAKAVNKAVNLVKGHGPKKFDGLHSLSRSSSIETASFLLRGPR